MAGTISIYAPNTRSQTHSCSEAHSTAHRTTNTVATTTAIVASALTTTATATKAATAAAVAMFKRGSNAVAKPRRRFVAASDRGQRERAVRAAALTDRRQPIAAQWT
eukprot:6184298-Pleurochrysis_carterae.AAC.1